MKNLKNEGRLSKRLVSGRKFLDLTWWNSDLVQIVRDPILAVMAAAPILLIAVFKLLMVFLIPWIEKQTGFVFAPYEGYVLSFVLLMTPGMLGVVTGFLLLDEKDGHIDELLTVTPLGRSGYLYHRLMFCAMPCVVYNLMAFFILGGPPLTLLMLLMLTLFSPIYSCIVALLLFRLAEDKVKGLTLAKGLNLLNLFALADLLALPWLTTLSWFFPSYWVTRIIYHPDSFTTWVLGLFVHLAWLGLLMRKNWKIHD